VTQMPGLTASCVILNAHRATTLPLTAPHAKLAGLIRGSW